MSDNTTDAPQATTNTPATTHTPAKEPAVVTSPAPRWIDGSDYDPDKARAFVDKVEAERKEAAERLKRLDELEAKQREADEAAMTEQQKLASRAEGAEKKLLEAEAKWQAREKELTERVVKLTVQLAAQELNIIDSEAAYALMDRSKLELDEAGLPKYANAKKVLEALVQAKPYLLKAEATTRTPQTGNGPSPKPQGREPLKITPLVRMR